MRTKEEILTPFVEKPFRHTKIVESDNALLAMEQWGREVAESLGFGWIPSKETPPPDYVKVILFDSRDKSQSIGYCVWSQTPVSYITHWAYLRPNPETP